MTYKEKLIHKMLRMYAFTGKESVNRNYVYVRHISDTDSIVVYVEPARFTIRIIHIGIFGISKRANLEKYNELDCDSIMDFIYNSI